MVIRTVLLMLSLLFCAAENACGEPSNMRRIEVNCSEDGGELSEVNLPGIPGKIYVAVFKGLKVDGCAPLVEYFGQDVESRGLDPLRGIIGRLTDPNEKAAMLGWSKLRVSVTATCSDSGKSTELVEWGGLVPAVELLIRTSGSDLNPYEAGIITRFFDKVAGSGRPAHVCNMGEGMRIVVVNPKCADYSKHFRAVLEIMSEEDPEDSEETNNEDEPLTGTRQRRGVGDLSLTPGELSVH